MVLQLIDLCSVSIEREVGGLWRTAGAEATGGTEVQVNQVTEGITQIPELDPLQHFNFVTTRQFLQKLQRHCHVFWLRLLHVASDPRKYPSINVAGSDMGPAAVLVAVRWRARVATATWTRAASTEAELRATARPPATVGTEVEVGVVAVTSAPETSSNRLTASQMRYVSAKMIYQRCRSGSKLDPYIQDLCGFWPRQVKYRIF